jgi:pimeloyl-ACP methyl ester carboxylesterase
MKEKALLLGEKKTLLSILSEPEVVSKDRPIFILLNAGIVHRVGPNRKSVKLARALAQAGFRCLRLDLSGIGDSPPRRDAQSFGESAIADIGEVLDDLEALYNPKGFVLFGLCSGADNALQVAQRDKRIVGTVMIDGVAYRTPRYYLQHYGPRLNRPAVWFNFARRAAEKVAGKTLGRLPLPTALKETLLGSEPEEVHALPVADYVREFESRELVSEQLQGLVNRGVKMYWLYTAGMSIYYNYERQFFDCFKSVDFKGMVDHDYFADSDHTFTELAKQRVLLDSVVDWSRRRF